MVLIIITKRKGMFWNFSLRIFLNSHKSVLKFSAFRKLIFINIFKIIIFNLLIIFLLYFKFNVFPFLSLQIISEILLNYWSCSSLNAKYHKLIINNNIITLKTDITINRLLLNISIFLMLFLRRVFCLFIKLHAILALKILIVLDLKWSFYRYYIILIICARYCWLLSLFMTSRFRLHCVARAILVLLLKLYRL